MGSVLSDIDKLDAAKLHAEINQLRNQQFMISIAALSFFGVVIAWILPEKSVLGQAEKVAAAGFAIAFVIGFLFALGLLFFWLTRLTKMITRISTYLVAQELSNWEGRHAIYCSRHPDDTSQRRTMSSVFVTLGCFASAAPPSLVIWGPYVFDGSSPLQPQAWWIILAVALLLYIGAIRVLGTQTTEDYRAKIEGRWRQLRP